MAAAASAGVSHLVYISLVGADTASWGYTKTKLQSERIVAGSGIPWTLQRSTQFFQLILAGAKRMGKLPLIPVPRGFVIQPVDPRDVARRLAELTLDAPAGRVPDIGGPEVLSFADLISSYLTAIGHPGRKVVAVPLPGTGKIRAGSLLPDESAGPVVRGSRTWSEFLAEGA